VARTGVLWLLTAGLGSGSGATGIAVAVAACGAGLCMEMLSAARSRLRHAMHSYGPHGRRAGVADSRSYR